MNEHYKIQITDTNSNTDIYCILNDRTYVLEDKEYIETKINIEYSDPNVFFEGLNNISKYSKEAPENIAEKEYIVYLVNIKKTIMEHILKNTSLSNLNFGKDVEAKILIDEDGFLYKIIYYLVDSAEGDYKNLEFNATYFRINKANEIKLDNLELEINSDNQSKKQKKS